MTTTGGTGPPNSPIGSVIDPEESFSSINNANMVAEPTNDPGNPVQTPQGNPGQSSQGSGQTLDGDADDKMVKMVATTVEQ
eukprot:6754425-Karenia_brevis.AAC.1